MKRARSWEITDKKNHNNQNKIRKFIFREYGLYDIVREYMKDNLKVLDFGSGSCSLFDTFKDSYKDVKYHAYDIDEDALKIAKKKGYKTFNYLHGLEYGYDIIFMNSVIEHLQSNEAIKTIKFLSNSLKKGGKLIIETINTYELFNILTFYNDPEHEKMYSIKALKELGEQNNLKMLKVHKHHIRLNPFRFLLDLLTADIYCGYAIVLEK